MDKLRPVFQEVRNPGDREWVYRHRLQLLSQWKWLQGVKCTGQIKEGDSHCAADVSENCQNYNLRNELTLMKIITTEKALNTIGLACP